MLKAFRKTKATDRELDLVQQNVASVLNPVVRNPLLQGTALKGLVADVTETKFNHGLGRVPEGYIVTDIDKSAVIFRSSWDANFITLTSSAASTTFSLWVF